MCNVAIISCRLTAVFYTYICSFITAARISDDINIFKMAAVCHFEFAKFWFFWSRDGSWNQNLHWHTKLHKNRMICGWDIAIKPKAKGLYKSYSQSVAPYHIYPPAFNYYSSPAVPLRGEGWVVLRLVAVGRELCAECWTYMWRCLLWVGKWVREQCPVF